MEFFKNFPEFVEYDTRKTRGWAPVNFETLDNRHEVSLPKWLVEGNTIVDLGSCLGASGQWVLSNGCSHYTGVEVQAPMAEKSVELLSKYWTEDKFAIYQADLRSFLDECISNNKKFDVVIMIGVIYAFLDTYGILEKVSKICNYALVIDGIYPWHMTSPNNAVIGVIPKQHINSSESNTAFAGVGCRPSPAALRTLMDVLGFEDKEGLLYPKPLSDKSVHDTYNTPLDVFHSRSIKLPARFLMRLYNTGNKTNVPVSEVIVNSDFNNSTPMAEHPKVEVADTWAFDDTVAKRFQQEAETHIPDYSRVINLCTEITEYVFSDNKDISIIDVGSALGHTMDVFINKGYKNVYGIDNSKAMIDASKYPGKVVLSNIFPKDNTYDVVLANWTLHFVNEREQYLEDIFDSLNAGGILILSDKMDHTQEIEDLYYNFKRSNGVSEEVIQKKKSALIGILTTRPLQWYTDVLKKIGFSNVQLVNNKFMFSTIYARKL